MPAPRRRNACRKRHRTTSRNACRKRHRTTTRSRRTADLSLVQTSRANRFDFQLTQDAIGNRIWRLHHIDDQGIPWLLQRSKLGFEQSGFHVMILACFEALTDQVEDTFQIDPVKIPTAVSQAVAIFLFQCGTCKQHTLMFGLLLEQHGIHAVEPRPSVHIFKGYTAAHLFDVLHGVKLIGIVQMPPGTLGEYLTDGGFADARYTHQDHHHDGSAGCTAWPPKPARIMANSFDA